MSSSILNQTWVPKILSSFSYLESKRKYNNNSFSFFFFLFLTCIENLLCIRSLCAYLIFLSNDIAAAIPNLLVRYLGFQLEGLYPRLWSWEGWWGALPANSTTMCFYLWANKCSIFKVNVLGWKHFILGGNYERKQYIFIVSLVLLPSWYLSSARYLGVIH